MINLKFGKISEQIIKNNQYPTKYEKKNGSNQVEKRSHEAEQSLIFFFCNYQKQSADMYIHRQGIASNILLIAS